MRKLFKSKRKIAGFSLAEVMVVIAIIGILSAVGFVGVVSYLRSLTSLEYDGYAKEIFVSAQNHLVVAETQGYLDRLSDSGLGAKADPSATTDKKGIRYFVVTNKDGQTDSDLSDSGKLLKQMLPVNSIDDTIRLGGSYLIRYDADTVRVMDVVYWKEGDGRYAFNSAGTLDADLYEMFLVDSETRVDDTANPQRRKDYGENRSVIGWFGGEAGLEITGEPLKSPEIKVNNAETLHVVVTDPNPTSDNHKLKLIITGEQSKAAAEIEIPLSGALPEYIRKVDGKYIVTLDDITTRDYNFGTLLNQDDIKTSTDKSFVPGENIIIRAKAYLTTNTLRKQNLEYRAGYSIRKKTNSLFSTLTAKKATAKTEVTATIKNIRHLENLSNSISGFDPDAFSINRTAVDVYARQMASFRWSTFKTKVNELKELGADSPVSIYRVDRTKTNETFDPIKIAYTLKEYDGRGHSIKNVAINTTGNAGLFDKLGIRSGVNGVDKVQNLKLVDFDVRGTDAGALAGESAGAMVENVIAVNDDERRTGIQGTNSAGGLIGTVSSGEILKCAAAMYVSGDTAGGLIGSMTGGTVEACYAGGHTGGGEYKADSINVNGTGFAGGLIGTADAGTLSYSYSTCSVSGGIAGGFVASSAAAIDYCYATGKVFVPVAGGVPDFTGQGAFAGANSGSITACQYFEIINENSVNNEVQYLGAVANAEHGGVTTLDQMDSGYYVTGTTGNDREWKPAAAYDQTLVWVYQGKYNLPTVAQLIDSDTRGGEKPRVKDDDFVQSHYGDWPAPEVWVKND